MDDARGAVPADDFSSLERIGLTPRECEVLTWVGRGKRNADIGRILGITTKTVGKHIENIFAKLQVENRILAVTQARERLRQLRTTL